MVNKIPLLNWIHSKYWFFWPGLSKSQAWIENCASKLDNSYSDNLIECTETWKKVYE